MRTSSPRSTSCCPASDVKFWARELLCSRAFIGPVRSPLQWELRTGRSGRELDVHVVVARAFLRPFRGGSDAGWCGFARVALYP